MACPNSIWPGWLWNFLGKSPLKSQYNSSLFGRPALACYDVMSDKWPLQCQDTVLEGRHHLSEMMSAIGQWSPKADETIKISSSLCMERGDHNTRNFSKMPPHTEKIILAHFIVVFSWPHYMIHQCNYILGFGRLLVQSAWTPFVCIVARPNRLGLKAGHT